jgi:hypothetical protein
VTSAVQKHVLDHVKEMVETNPVVIDGCVYHPDARGPRRDQYTPISAYRNYSFYVCPRTGLLQRAPWRKRSPPPSDPNVRRLRNWVEARRIEGIWYAVTFAKVPATQEEYKGCFDVVIKARLSEPRMLDWNGGLEQAYGRRDQYAIGKRQLSKRELRTYGLS